MNSDGFTKLFSSILTSSIWSEDDKTRILWITILACTDRDGFCSGSVPGLAAMSRLSPTDTSTSLTKLESPDPFSRTSAHEGRRLQKVDGGWLVLNYGLYRDKERAEKRREYMAVLMRNRRANDANKMLTGANPSASVSASVSASDISGGGCKGGAKKENRSERSRPSDALALAAYFLELGMPETEAQKFNDHYMSNGWHVGKSPMRDWKAAARNWRKGYHPEGSQADKTSTLINTWHDPTNPRRNAF